MSVLWSYLSPSRISQPARLRGKVVQHLELTSVQRLTRIFAAWKLLLLVVAVASPGHGYDTSTRILFDRHRDEHDSWVARAVEYVVLRLTRWDAIYFASGSESGQIYEQEWAFSWMMSNATSTLAGVFLWPLPTSAIVKHALAGVLTAHISHLLAAVILYHLVHFITPSTEARKSQLAFTTACLHVISPAGIFLSAPYGEATFALFNILGLLCYAHAVENRFSTFADAYQLDACWTIGAGICFGLASMVRSNGLLSDLIFAWDALAMLPSVPSIFSSRDTERLTRLLSVIAAGTILALALAVPQALAYAEYCMPTATRPWCTALPPSIYSFVQAYYWDVGFLRYWKISNLPLFAIALPVGWTMVETAIPSLFQAHHVNRVLNGSTEADQKLQPYPPKPATRQEKVFQHCLPRFALPQLVLVALAATSFHCQIINRISSGYPVWYMFIAVEICISGWENERGKEQPKGDDRQERMGQTEEWRKALFRMFNGYDRIPSARLEWVVRTMVVYAVVQAGLYAAFLPPA